MPRPGSNRDAGDPYKAREVKSTTSRWTEILRAIKGEIFRADAQIDVPARLVPTIELGAIVRSIFTGPGVAQESFYYDNQINQIGAQALVANPGPQLAAGVWRIRGFATIAGAIAVGNNAWNFNLVDPTGTAFALAAWRTVAGVQVAQRFWIDHLISVEQPGAPLVPWQFFHNAPATAAGDTLLMRVCVMVNRLL